MISKLSHLASTLGHSQKFRDPSTCFEKSLKPSCSLFTHVTLHKKGSGRGKSKNLKGNYIPA